MNKNYHFLTLILGLFILLLMSPVQGQVIGDIIWEDHFDDEANDFLLNNVGWMYFGEDDGLVGQQVLQTAEETAWVKSGIFSFVVGASIIQTNGVAFIDPEDEDGTEARIKAQNANTSPNQDLTFQVNFKSATLVEGGQYPMGTFFICGTSHLKGLGTSPKYASAASCINPQYFALGVFTKEHTLTECSATE